MIIGVDVREIEDGVHTGIGRALYDFLLFAAASGADELVVFSRKALPFELGPRVRSVVMARRWGVWWDQVCLPWAVSRAKVDVFYSPYYKIPVLASCRKVCAILDLIDFQFEPYEEKRSIVVSVCLKLLMSFYARMADLVVTCSAHSRGDILRLLHLNPAKVVVVPLTASDCFSPEVDAHKMRQMRQVFGIPSAYILYVGNLKAHKNVSTLIDAFALLVHEFKPLSLVMAGPKTHEYARLYELCRNRALLERVIFTDTITDEKMAQALYVGAEMCVMPSLYEGFGLPLVEAMACGTPVVCSRATSLPEVGGGAVLYFDPKSHAELAQNMRCLLLHKDIGLTMVNSGLKEVEKFRVNKVMPQLLDMIKGVGL